MTVHLCKLCRNNILNIYAMILHFLLILTVGALSVRAASIEIIQPRNDKPMLVDITCRWSNCGEMCPIGFVSVPRKGGKKDEMMWDHTQCKATGGVSQLCCPSNQCQPTCLWRGFANNGKCKPGCNGGEVEVWSTGFGCKSGHQSACCTTNTPSIEAYDNCRWEGDAPNCWSTLYPPAPACSSLYPQLVTYAIAGFGGETKCKQGMLHCISTSIRHSIQAIRKARARYGIATVLMQFSGKKAYCCRKIGVSITPPAFQECRWGTYWLGEMGKKACQAACPPNWLKLAVDPGRCGKEGGMEAYCCQGMIPKSEKVLDFTLALERYTPLILCGLRFTNTRQLHDCLRR
jgi:chitinase